MAIHLKPGDIISNQELCNIFKCSPQGGMRRSQKTNTLVLISDHIKGIYEDRWSSDNVFHYTGMGLKGDQTLDFMQNKTLAESNKNKIDLYLFEVFSPGKYFFHSKVYLCSQPYQENQLDMSNNLRKVWMFPLKLIDKRKPYPILEELLDYKQKKKTRIATKLSLSLLKKRAENANQMPSLRVVQSNRIERNLYISEFAKRRANGYCELCKQPAPFKDKNGVPFLETHHIQWLSNGGLDSIDNTVALCPNCHRKMHVLNKKNDILTLKKRFNIIP